jgi:glutathione synthase/RimK-type ligase-like ATP-grasp enzyme
LTTKRSAESAAQRILLTGGRAPVALELARLMHRAGHRVFAAESSRYHLTRVSRAVERSCAVPAPLHGADAYITALEEIVLRERIDVLIPSNEEIFHVAGGIQRIARHCKVWSAPLDTLHALHHKGRFAALAEQFCLSVPRTTTVTDPAQWLALAEQAAVQEGGGGLVLKPVYSRFASRVMVLSPTEPKDSRQRRLEAAVSAVSDRTPWAVQQYIEGSHYCSYSIAYEGCLIAHAAYPSRYRVGLGASVHFEQIEHPGIRAWVSRFVEAAGFTGQLAFDFIAAKDGRLYAIECNPRATSGIHLFAPADRLERAFLAPEQLAADGTVIEPRDGSGAMLAVPMLLSGLKSMRSRSEWQAWRNAYRNSRDVVYRRSDPAPAWEQLHLAWDVWRISRRLRIPLTEATTYDIEWNGE